MADDFITIDQACDLLDRGRATIWKLVRRHKIPTYKRPLDRRTYVRKADFEQLLTMYIPRGEANAAA